MTEAEPLEGITDAIQAAQEWLSWANCYRDRPEVARYSQWEALTRRQVILRLQALGEPGYIEIAHGGVAR